ncbi:hypothetical protein F5Y16DRAFT_81215 [Xylariaceae sp. FL0255]|nr:hypothetical protein F5Y16DRAFT_81215 [Xylariaceae sp. FL0255]
MLFKATILAAGAVGVTTAQITSFSPACQSALSALANITTDEPAVPTSLYSELATISEKPCVVPTYPAAVSQALASYEAAALSWYHEHKSQFDAYESACSTSYPAQTSVTYTQTTTYSSQDCSSVLASLSSLDSSLSASATGTATTTTTGGSGSSTSPAGTNAASSSTKNAAPRETGALNAAAALAVGFVGVVAAL